VGGKVFDMSMAEPLLPHPASDDPVVPAAEPGSGGPAPASAEEPDVLPAGWDEETDVDLDLEDREEPVFRTPVAGERLHPDDLRASDGG
jgi:hypothetical protein